MNSTNFKIGQKVKFKSNDIIANFSESISKTLPKNGTVGKINKIYNDIIFVDWDNKNDANSVFCSNWCYKDWVEPYLEEDNSEAIKLFQVLIPEFKKNKKITFDCEFIKKNIDTYISLINAIYVAYNYGIHQVKCHNLIDKNKVKISCGHWEPIDCYNIPPEGTKVKYSRFCANKAYLSDSNWIAVGDTGKLKKHLNFIGIELDKQRHKGVDWVSFDEHIDALDKWVED